MIASDIFSFRSLSRYRYPYPFFVCEQVFEKPFALRLLEFLETFSLWSLALKEFYQQYEFDFGGQELPSELQKLVEPGSLRWLVDHCATVFQAELLPVVSISAHKLIAGQWIGIHSDKPVARYGFETHRLTVQLNRGGDELSGGQLIVHAGKEPGAFQQTIQPVHNSGFGFAMSRDSHHSVGPVILGERYSIVFSFRGNVPLSVEDQAARQAAASTSTLFFAAQ